VETPDSVVITPRDKRILDELLNRFLPNVKVIAYGSRVKGTARASSDLDLVVFASSSQLRQVEDFREAEESDLTFRVDLFIWEDLPVSFRNGLQANIELFSLVKLLEVRTSHSGCWTFRNLTQRRNDAKEKQKKEKPLREFGCRIKLTYIG